MAWWMPRAVAALAVAALFVLTLWWLPLQPNGGGVALPWLACAGAGLLAAQALAPQRAALPGSRRALDAAWIVVGAVAVWAYWAPYQLSLDRYLHRWDAFHYYVGGKYFAELGYDGLYECTLVADADAGFEDRARRTWVRDLRSNALGPGASVLARADCGARFSEERWQAFRDDVAWFRARFVPGRWVRLFSDHGFNPPPTWLVLAAPLLASGPASASQLAWLVAIDPLLVALALAAVAWTFGLRVAVVALLFFVGHLPSDQRWVAGSILRLDWFAASLAGICLLRTGRYAGAGGLLAYASAVRLFPLALYLGVGLQALVRAARARGRALPAGFARLIAASAAVALLWPALAATVGGGPERWSDFVQNSRTHLATPLTNYMGLRAIVSFDPSRRQAATGKGVDANRLWKRGRTETFEARRAWYGLLVCGYLALLGVAVLRQPPWIASALCAGAPLMLFDLTCYYHVLLGAFALLAGCRPWVGVGLLLYVAASQWALPVFPTYQDELFLAIGLGAVALVVAVTATFARSARGETG